MLLSVATFFHSIAYVTITFILKFKENSYTRNHFAAAADRKATAPKIQTNQENTQ